MRNEEDRDGADGVSERSGAAAESGGEGEGLAMTPSEAVAGLSCRVDDMDDELGTAFAVLMELAAHKMTEVVAENARLREALARQSDNMAFVLNNASLPDQWYAKFTDELAIDRAALKGVGS